jgi:hypothetical protein
MHTLAKESLGSLVTDEQLTELVASTRKLEVVLARLSGTAGIHAAECLLALQVEVPNEAHMLAALHLALGGIHVTLNFDIGIELAYSLLTGDSGVPSCAPDGYRSAVPDWQALVPSDTPSLRVVASHAEFDRWMESGQDPALLKIHGSLSRDQRQLVDVVALDIDEIGQLTRSRRAAVDRLGSVRRLLITGYSGADPDVYGPLIEVASASSSSWRCYSLPQDSPVPKDLQLRGIDLSTGAPSGLAVTALRELLNFGTIPSWPDVPLYGPGYRSRFEQWEDDFRYRHSPDEIAVAWAWLLADGGDLDTADSMLTALAARESAHPGTILRHAEVLYTRARSDDRDRAELLYLRLAADRDVDIGTRLMCRLRTADIARGRAIRGGREIVPLLARAFGQPVAVLLATRAGRRESEAAADAYRALQHTALRVIEHTAGMLPTSLWPALAPLCRTASLFGRPGERLAANGNRRGLIRQHRLLLASYRSLLAGRKSPPELRLEVTSLRNTYRNADDFPGSGNLAATLAVLAAADGDLGGADRLLREARADYAAGRPDARPIAAGEALLRAIEGLLRQLRKRESGQAQ